MEKFFKGLIERARYYEQFESFRAAPMVSEQVRDVQLGLKKKSSASVSGQFLKASP